MEKKKSISKWSWLVIVLCFLITVSTINLSPYVGAYETTTTKPTTTRVTTTAPTTQPTTYYTTTPSTTKPSTTTTTTLPTTGGYYTTDPTTTQPTTKYDCQVSGHIWGLVGSQTATCGAIFSCYECRVCWDVDERYIPPENNEHLWDGGGGGKSATCFEDGYIIYTCTGCEETKYETIPAAGDHDYYYIINNDATCLDDGTKTLACRNKRCNYKGEKVINEGSALGHNFKNGWQIIKNPSCEDKGIDIQICNRCLFIESRELEKTKHTDSNSDSVCDVCDEKLKGTADTDKSEEDAPCLCNCHTGGLKNLFFKIVLFFQRFMGLNKICTCGTVHY